MKTKNISIMLFILLFAGVALLGYTPARADWNRTCTDGTITDGSCAQFGDPALWTMKPFLGCQDNDGNTVACDVKDPTNQEVEVIPGVNWPLCDATGRLIYQYIAGPVQPLVKKGKVTAAVSYLVLDLFDEPLEGFIPGGAALTISKFDSLFGGCDPGYRDGLAFKLNASINNKTDAIISLPYPLGTVVNTEGHSWMKWASSCDFANIWTPDEGEAGQVLTEPSMKTYNNCTGYTVTVTRDVCGRIESVTCNGDEADLKTDAQLCFDLNEDGDVYDTIEIDGVQVNECAENANLGPRAGGSAVCTSPAPVFVYGEYMWFCPSQ